MGEGIKPALRKDSTNVEFNGSQLDAELVEENASKTYQKLQKLLIFESSCHGS